MVNIKVLLILVFLPALISAELLFASVFTHHGRKSFKDIPMFPGDNSSEKYTDNPYEDGELSNQGEWDSYSQGRNLREAYGALLGYRYRPSQLKVRSRTVHRSITSVQLALAGFLPPTNEKIWNPNLLWQPIPVYTEKLLDVASTGYLYECPKLGKEVMSSGIYDEIFQTFGPLADLVRNKTGRKVENMFHLQSAMGAIIGRYSARKIYPAPPWLTADFMKDFEYQYYLVNQKLYDPINEKLGGWHYDQLLSGMEDRLWGEATPKKMYIYSVHEANAIIMTEFFKIGIAWKKLPTVSSYFAFELHREGNESVVKVFNHDKVNGSRDELFISKCPKPCRFEEFANLGLERLTTEQWDFYCSGPPETSSVVPIVIGSFLLLLLLGACLLFCLQKRNTNSRKEYQMINGPERRNLL